MIKIRIFRAQALARLKWLSSGDVGGLVVAAVIVGASLIAGDSEDHGTLSSLPVTGGDVDKSSVGEAPDPFPVRADAGAVPSVLAATPRARISPAAIRAADVSLRSASRHPANLFQLPRSVKNALVFDLQDNRMHVYEVGGEGPRSIGDYFVAVGKKGIWKLREGDEKTPIGIYFVSSYIPGDSLPAIYGVGAFPISYPNAWDRRLGRTGSGIWIHGTDKDDESLLPQSSRGCLTLRNADFMTLSQFVRIRRTPVIVSDTVQWTLPVDLESDRASLAAAVETWRRDWESLNTDSYLRHYSAEFRTDSMNIKAWTAYKRRVNSAKKFIRVGVDDVGIYAYPGEQGLYLVTFEQSYKSNNYQARRWKHQYWRREAGDWRIVQESGV